MGIVVWSEKEERDGRRGGKATDKGLFIPTDRRSF